MEAHRALTVSSFQMVFRICSRGNLPVLTSTSRVHCRNKHRNQANANQVKPSFRHLVSRLIIWLFSHLANQALARMAGEQFSSIGLSDQVGAVGFSASSSPLIVG